MKALLTLLISALALCLPAYAGGSKYVKGHVSKNGTYVPPHMRSGADSYRSNNWSASGNYNPYTGKKGYRK